MECTCDCFELIRVYLRKCQESQSVPWPSLQHCRQYIYADVGLAFRAGHFDWYERIRVYFREYEESHYEESQAHETHAEAHADAHDKEQAAVPDLKTGGMWNQRRMRFLMEWAGL